MNYNTVKMLTMRHKNPRLFINLLNSETSNFALAMWGFGGFVPI